MTILLGIDVNETAWIKILGVHDRRVDVRKNLEVRPDPNVISVTGHPVADGPCSLGALFKRRNPHKLFNLSIAEDAHYVFCLL